MDLKEQVRLHMIEVKIDMNLQAYEVQLQRLREEKALESNPEASKVLDKWIWMNEKRIELLTMLKH
jgi:hypothetical protein